MKDINIFNDVVVSEKKLKIIQLKYASERLIKYFTYQKDYLEDIKKFNKKKKNGESRINRYEGREALYQVSKSLFSNLELSTMQIEGKSGRGFTHSRIASYCNGLSYHRYKRAFLKLVKAGFVETERKFEKSNTGKYFALPAVKRITYKFFKALGIEKYYSIGKNWKIKKLEEAGMSRKIKKDLDKKISEITFFQSKSLKSNKKHYVNKPVSFGTIFSKVDKVDNQIFNKNISSDELRKNLLNFKINDYLENNQPNQDLFMKFKNLIYSYSEDMLFKAAKNIGLA